MGLGIYERSAIPWDVVGSEGGWRDLFVGGEGRIWVEEVVGEGERVYHRHPPQLMIIINSSPASQPGREHHQQNSSWSLLLFRPAEAPAVYSLLSPWFMTLNRADTTPNQSKTRCPKSRSKPDWEREREFQPGWPDRADHLLYPPPSNYFLPCLPRPTRLVCCLRR